jgi:hypothetical protein
VPVSRRTRCHQGPGTVEVNAPGLALHSGASVLWEAIDLEAGTLEVRGTVICIEGQGLIIKPGPKTPVGFRKLLLPR